MKVSDAYREANGFTPEKIADVMIGFYEKIDARCAEIERRIEREGVKLNCRPGCCGCCRDGLTMTQAEAAVIRKQFPDIGKALPHPQGACPFLDDDGLCRIYSARPYICRTHGLPMRYFLTLADALEMGMIEAIPEDHSPDQKIELRDICELNTLDVMDLPEEACWASEIAEAQLAAMDACTFGDAPRVEMRSFFEK
ncbi:MAG: YkgJ family cysteine cluster protein [Proteobacteria bacterium]|nr:YkgJ family cysteine cluster protein [Pseudomonadota bacterium]